MKLHRVAKNFPRMSNAEMAALKTQVKEQGIIEPCYTWEDDKGEEWLIDGGNRQQAVKELLAEGVTEAANGKKIELDTKRLKGSLADVIHFVEAKNGPGRRHLSSSQRAACAILTEADLIKESGEEKEITDERISALAERWDTNTVYLYACKTFLLAGNREVLNAVRDGDLNISQAKIKAAEMKAQARAEANGKVTSKDVAEAKKGKDGEEEPEAEPEKPAPPPPPPVIILDGLKNPVVEVEFQPIFEKRADFRIARKGIMDALKELELLVKDPAGKFLKPEYDELRSSLKHCAEVVDAVTPFCVCLVCKGEGRDKDEKKCEVCAGKKFVSRAFFRATPKEFKVGVVDE